MTDSFCKAGVVYESKHRGSSSMTHHRHAAPFVTIVLSGGYVEVNDGVPEVCCEGAVVAHPAGEEHADRFARDTRCLNVELPVALRAPASSRIPGLGSLTSSEAARRVVTAYYRDPSSLPSEVLALAAALEYCRAERIGVPSWLQRVIDDFDWIDAAPLREAAALAGLHETHFSRAFRQHMGMTANEYRARARVRYASKLLLGTSASISRVAISAGLSDQSHLTRLFSTRLGVSPAAYRQSFAR
jgi:AraC family transcriptional regulator